MISYSPNFEDVLLERCFAHVRSGFYVDIGAHHPTSASITRWFYDRGWSGINIEPGQGIAALREERPRDINLEVAVADFEGQTTFFVHSGNTGTSTLSSAVPAVVAEKAGEIQPITVQVTTLAAIIERHAEGRHIHFLKVDAEGAEDAIVRAADWVRHRPEVIVIESTEPYTNIRRKEAWQGVLEQNRYSFAYFDGVNDFWVRDESRHLAQHFAVPLNVLDSFQPYNPQLEWMHARLAEKEAELATMRSELKQLRKAAKRRGLFRFLKKKKR